MKKRACITTIIFVLFALSSLTPFVPPVTPSVEVRADNTYDKKKVVVVSLGDSYSSGEGIEPYYDQEKPLEEKVNSHDWLAHRSEKSWPGKLRIPDFEKELKYYRVKEDDSAYTGEDVPCEWYFAAVSGAKTENIYAKAQVKEYNKRFSEEGNNLAIINKIQESELPEHLAIFDQIKESERKTKKFFSGNQEKLPRNFFLEGQEPLPKQIDIFDHIQEDVDYVTMTIGGNDVGFVKIITNAAMKSTFLGSTVLENQMNDLRENLSAIKDKLKNTYDAIAEAAGDKANILIAGYPKLIGKKNRGVGLFSVKESDLIDTNVSFFNDIIEEVVEDCRKQGMNIHFVDVEEEFDKDGGHQAYSNTKDPWINNIKFLRCEDINDHSLVSHATMHPNEEGAKAYARCVNAKIKEIEDSKREEQSFVAATDDQDISPEYHLIDEHIIVTKEINHRLTLLSYAFAWLNEDQIEPESNAQLYLNIADILRQISFGDPSTAIQSYNGTYNSDGVMFECSAINREGLASLIDQYFTTDIRQKMDYKNNYFDNDSSTLHFEDSFPLEEYFITYAKQGFYSATPCLVESITQVGPYTYLVDFSRYEVSMSSEYSFKFVGVELSDPSLFIYDLTNDEIQKDYPNDFQFIGEGQASFIFQDDVPLIEWMRFY